jgi:predicted RNase H-like nuclease (RuvC/YqgF family)
MSMSDQDIQAQRHISDCHEKINQLQQVLTAAEARIAELEGLLQRIESNARNALLSLGVSEADVETPDPVFSLTVLAKPQRFGYVQGYVDALTAAAALAAAAVGERCEENT